MTTDRCRYGAAWSLGLMVLLASGCAQSGAMPGAAGTMPMDQASVQQRMNGWHPASQEAATFMMDKYGPPASMTETMMVWNQTGPWKRTIIYREAVQHDFPMPHPDVMEQFIDYRMPPERFDEMAMYDGSVIVERTKGEMSARCDKEAMNFLALNLANDIAMGQRTVEEARQFYAEQAMAFKQGRGGPYTQGLQFTPPPSGNDPDQPVM